eukprot:11539443-Heterocapsa_arctica.AAC.1
MSAERMHEEAMKKILVQQQQQQKHIEQQQAQIELLRIQWHEMRATVGEVQDFLRRESVSRIA